MSKYKNAEKLAAIDAIRKSQCVVTTSSQIADKLLIETKKSLYTIHDEVCQTSDVTSLMPLFNNRETVVRHIMIGDPKQFDSIRKTAGKRVKEGNVSNPFGPQLDVEMFSGLRNHDMVYVLLQEQPRQAANFSDIISKTFYDE